MKHVNRFALVVVGLVAVALSSAAGVRDAKPAKLQFVESYRQESMTRTMESGFSTSTETRTASKGKLALAAEFPLDAVTPTRETEFFLSAGGFEFKQILGSDPSFRPGDTSAKLLLTRPSESGKSQFVLATAELRWTKERLFVKIEAKLPEVKPVAATDFLGSLPGDVSAASTVSLRFGAESAALNLNIEGKLRKRTAGGGDVFGEVITVDIKGRTDR
jgi:hypothetical protein